MIKTRPSRILHPEFVRRLGAAVIAFTMTAAGVLMFETSAGAAIVPTVPLLTAGNYSVLAGSTVTNTGFSVLNLSLGLSPGTAITGFPPGVVVPPATTDQTNGAAAQAQLDLTAAYIDAAGRPLNVETTADLSGLTLVGGVYATVSKGALSLTGTLTLDGENDPNSVFIFQTDSTLITSTASTVTLINGAQQCNVFWQVGSSATLGSNSVFVGNILALTSITVTTDVTVQGRALARNGAVTLDDDSFNQPTCALTVPTTTTTTATTTTTTAAPTTTTAAPTTTTAVPTTTTATQQASNTTIQATTATSAGAAAVTTSTTVSTIASTTSTPTFELFGATTTTAPATELPFTGSATGTYMILASVTMMLGMIALTLSHGEDAAAVSKAKVNT